MNKLRSIGILTAGLVALTPSYSTMAMATPGHGSHPHHQKIEMRSTGEVSRQTNLENATLIPKGDGHGAYGADIVIDNASASHEYHFSYDFPAGYSMKMAYDGSVVIDNGTSAIGQIAVPWAKDANGKVIPTHFRVEGNTLIQVVDFSEGDAFPITADPWYDPRTWNWSKIGHVTASKLKKCGVGVVGGSAGAMGSSVAVNIVRNAAGKYLISTYGGPYGLIGVAAVSCVTAAMA